jgi:uncharacterized protein DUF3179
MQRATDSRQRLPAVVLLLALLPAACENDDGAGPALDEGSRNAACVVDPSEFQDGGVPRDGIPALTNPVFVSAGDVETEYLLPEDRVVAFFVDGQPYAIPHNILWWHEIVNLDLANGTKMAVTYCPLTGSAMAFDRSAANGAEFGVSGLLFQNNLIMVDRSNIESLWVQMMGQAVSGFRTCTSLPRIGVSELNWQAWVERHPNTLVVSGETGFNRDYTRYPYGDYEALDEFPFFPGDFDARRRLKERVLGIEGVAGSTVAFPFLALDAEGPVAVVNVTVDDLPLVVVWDRASASAVAYSRVAVSDLDDSTGQTRSLTFRVVDGAMRDDETGSLWSVDGRGISGPSESLRLEVYSRALVAFWFAWTSFHPETDLWLG